MNEVVELETWLKMQTARSVAALEQAISATHLCRRRDSFGQVIRPIAGSVLASPVIADWNPEPDYFFHWVRDSAIVIRTVAELMEKAPDPSERQRWARHFDDFVRFSLTLTELDGAAVAGTQFHAGPGAQVEFLRPPQELAALRGEALLGEPRFNPDGTVDVFRWSRPQYDGPALRFLACLRYLAAGGPLSAELARLLQRDLDFTIRHAGEPCIGPWEEPEQYAWHYYVELVQLGALVHARECALAMGEDSKREFQRQSAEKKLRLNLEQYWSERDQIMTAIRPQPTDVPDDLLDAATLLAAWDADLPDGPHSIADPRLQKTQTAIERLFAREFPINRGRAEGPALGRSRGDRYFGGGAWYPTTLAAAGLYYRLAERSEEHRFALVRRGDAFMETLQAFTPADGALSEQVDRTSGRQTSARHLTWSYAAFITTASLRGRVVAMDATPLAR